MKNEGIEIDGKLPQPEENIYEKVIVVLTDKKEYEVLNFRNRIFVRTIKSGIKDADTALAIKKAYCDGFYDGTHQ